MKSIVPASWLAFLALLLAVADVALADESFILATGRRDPRIYAIDFNAVFFEMDRDLGVTPHTPVQANASLANQFSSPRTGAVSQFR